MGIKVSLQEQSDTLWTDPLWTTLNTAIIINKIRHISALEIKKYSVGQWMKLNVVLLLSSKLNSGDTNQAADGPPFQNHFSIH